MYLWWDPINKAEFQAASGYPGFSSHGLGQIWRLGLAVKEATTQTTPASQRQFMIANWGDPAINLSSAQDIVRGWRSDGGDTTPALPPAPLAAARHHLHRRRRRRHRTHLPSAPAKGGCAV